MAGIHPQLEYLSRNDQTLVALPSTIANMADTEYNAEEAAEIKKRRAFKKFQFRGVDLEKYVVFIKCSS